MCDRLVDLRRLVRVSRFPGKEEYQGYDYETVQIGEQCWFAKPSSAILFERRRSRTCWTLWSSASLCRVHKGQVLTIGGPVDEGQGHLSFWLACAGHIVIHLRRVCEAGQAFAVEDPQTVIEHFRWKDQFPPRSRARCQHSRCSTNISFRERIHCKSQSLDNDPSKRSSSTFVEEVQVLDDL